MKVNKKQKKAVQKEKKSFFSPFQELWRESAFSGSHDFTRQRKGKKYLESFRFSLLGAGTIAIDPYSRNNIKK